MIEIQWLRTINKKKLSKTNVRGFRRCLETWICHKFFQHFWRSIIFMTDFQHFGTILEKLCIEGIFLQQKVSGSLRTINQKNLIAMGKQNLPKHNTVKCLTKQTWYWPILISSHWFPTSLSDHMNAQKKSASYLFLWTNWPLSSVFKNLNHPLYVGLERRDKTWSGASFCNFPTVGMHWLTLQSWAFPSISFGSPLGGGSPDQVAPKRSSTFLEGG